MTIRILTRGNMKRSFVQKSRCIDKLEIKKNRQLKKNIFFYSQRTINQLNQKRP